MEAANRDNQIQTFLRDAVEQLAPWLKSTHVIGLGTHCYTSWVLKQAGLKATSMPFDWMFCSPPMAAHCLDDDFATFLDKKWYSPVPVEDRQFPHVNLCDHRYYRDRFGVRFAFNHRNPTREDDYGYFVRAVERIRDIARSDDGVLILTTFRDYHGHEEHFQELEQSVRRYFSSCKLIGVAIKGPSGTLPESRVISKTEDCTLLMFTPSSEWEALQFQSYFDDLCLFLALIEETRYAFPTTHAALFEMMKAIPSEGGLQKWANRFDWRGQSVAQIYQTVLARPQQEDEKRNSVGLMEPKAAFLTALQSAEFQTTTIRRICNAFPERQRLFFVHIPKCAGNTFSNGIAQRVSTFQFTLEDMSWVLPLEVIDNLSLASSKMAGSSSLFFYGHRPLKPLLESGLYRHGTDRIIFVIRHPLDILVSEANYIAETIINSERDGIQRADVIDWKRSLGIESVNDDPKTFALKVIGAVGVTFINSLCTYLGGSDFPSTCRLLSAVAVEITDITRCDQWLADEWKVEATEGPRNVSSKILSREDIPPSFDIGGRISEDLKLYEFLMRNIQESASGRVITTDILK